MKLIATHWDIRIHLYLDDCMVRARSHQGCLQHFQALVRICQKLGWLVNVEKSELEPKQVFGFVGYQFRPQIWLVSIDTRPVVDPSAENTGSNLPTGLSGPAVHVLNRSANSHREVSSPWPTAHEAHSMASQKQLEGTGITRKSHSYPQVLVPHLKWWLEESNVLQGQPLHPVNMLCKFLQAHQKKGGALT